jgi:hypothetical protein
LRASIWPEGLKRAMVARLVKSTGASSESPTTALTGEAEGVASKSAVKMSAWSG